MLKNFLQPYNNYMDIKIMKKYVFYYDETNNYRKVRITEKGSNDFKVMFDNSTLGGICFEKSKKRYGSPKIAKVLNSQGIKVSQKMVARGMKKLGLRSIIVKNLIIVVVKR